jgi:hypothetical protein
MWRNAPGIRSPRSQDVANRCSPCANTLPSVSDGKARRTTPPTRERVKNGPATRFMRRATGEACRKVAAITGVEAIQAPREMASGWPIRGSSRSLAHQGLLPARIPRVARKES